MKILKISYELALELEKTGYERKMGPGSLLLYKDGSHKYVLDVNELDWNDKSFVVAPTLSKLIEACGEMVLIVKEGYSTASAGIEGSGGKREQGETPETAVARLLIKLYNRDNAIRKSSKKLTSGNATEESSQAKARKA